MELSSAFLGQAAALVRRRAGLAFDLARQSILDTGLRIALQRSGSRTPEQYLERLEREESLLDDLLGEITIGETYFFRDADQFALLRDRILPDLLGDRPPDTPLRLWSAGCATGEEPYSLAILLHQFGQLARTKILGTDISRPMLRRAREARYSRWSLRGVPDELIERYFKRSGDRYALIPEVRDAVEFRPLNLASDRYPSLQSGVWAMDLVLCRNVLIYFAADRILGVAERLLETLAEGGWLLLGSTDPMITETRRCRTEVTPAGLVYRRGPLPARAASPPAEPLDFAVSSVQTVQFDQPFPVISAPIEDPAVEANRWYAVGDYERAVNYAREALARGTDTITLQMVLIKALVNCGRLEDAERACRVGRDHHGGCADLAALHAFVLLEIGYHREAEMTARQALYLDPGLPVAHLALGTALVRLRDTSGARRAFRNAERLLAALPSDMLIAGADDEPAGRLAELARTQLALLHESAS